MEEKKSKNDALRERASKLKATHWGKVRFKADVVGIDELEKTLEEASNHINEALDALKGLEQGVELGVSLRSEPEVDLER